MIWRIAQKMNDMPNDGRRSKKENCSHSRQLKAFIEIAGLINERLELKDMLTSISRKLAGIIDCDIICVAVYEEDDNCLYIRHIFRREEGLEGSGLPRRKLIGPPVSEAARSYSFQRAERPSRKSFNATALLCSRSFAAKTSVMTG